MKLDISPMLNAYPDSMGAPCMTLCNCWPAGI